MSNFLSHYLPHFNNRLVVGYLVFEFPALVMIRKFHAPTVYALGVMIFGATGIGMGFATTYAQVMILRLLLGFGEAVVQTSFVLLTLWYLREELSTRAGKICRCPIDYYKKSHYSQNQRQSVCICHDARGRRSLGNSGPLSRHSPRWKPWAPVVAVAFYYRGYSYDVLGCAYVAPASSSSGQ